MCEAGALRPKLLSAKRLLDHALSQIGSIDARYTDQKRQCALQAARLGTHGGWQRRGDCIGTRRGAIGGCVAAAATAVAVKDSARYPALHAAMAALHTLQEL